MPTAKRTKDQRRAAEQRRRDNAARRLPPTGTACWINLPTLEAAFACSRDTMHKMRSGKISLPTGLEIPAPSQTALGNLWWWPEIEDKLERWRSYYGSEMGPRAGIGGG